MSNFASYVSNNFPNLYIIYWSTDAEDVSCLEFQKKILDELNNLRYGELTDEILIKLYTNAAKNFIASCGNIERITDPGSITDKNDLKKLRPTGLNCLMKNKNIIANLKKIVEEIVREQEISMLSKEEVPELL